MMMTIEGDEGDEAMMMIMRTILGDKIMMLITAGDQTMVINTHTHGTDDDDDDVDDVLEKFSAC